MGGTSALRTWAREVERPDDEIDLARAALALARLEYPGLDPARYLERLDGLAGEVARRGDGRDPVARLHRLREYLFGEQGFAGNRSDYYDPRNSFLNDVLDRRLGIPITLSLVLIEVGRRLDLPLDGVGLPGHFVASLALGQSRILLDPFNGGTVVTPDVCEVLVGKALGRTVSLGEHDFAPVTRRQFLVRMLNNLKAVYWRREAWPKVVEVIDRWLVLDPRAATEWRDRGVARASMGHYHASLADWGRYLAECPDAADREQVQRRLRRVREAVAGLN